MSNAVKELTDMLVPISDFSQGKAGKIFSEVQTTGKERIVLRNNQPVSVVMPVDKYNLMQQKADQLERIMAYVKKNQEAGIEISAEDLKKEAGLE